MDTQQTGDTKQPAMSAWTTPELKELSARSGTGGKTYFPFETSSLGYSYGPS